MTKTPRKTPQKSSYTVDDVLEKYDAHEKRKKKLRDEYHEKYGRFRQYTPEQMEHKKRYLKEYMKKRRNIPKEDTDLLMNFSKKSEREYLLNNALTGDVDPTVAVASEVLSKLKDDSKGGAKTYRRRQNKNKSRRNKKQ